MFRIMYVSDLNFDSYVGGGLATVPINWNLQCGLIGNQMLIGW